MILNNNLGSTTINSVGTPLFSFDVSTLTLTIIKQTNTTYVGMHTLTLTGTVNMGTDVKSTVLQVLIRCNTQSLSPDEVDQTGSTQNMMAMQTYVVPGGRSVIPFKEFVPTLNCGNDISYTFLLNSGDPMPSFF